jgi:hypothetical protein
VIIENLVEKLWKEAAMICLNAPSKNSSGNIVG